MHGIDDSYFYRCRPSRHQEKTPTGRSPAGPNQQGINPQTEEGKRIREAFNHQHHWITDPASEEEYCSEPNCGLRRDRGDE